MNRVLENTRLSEEVFQMRVEAPLIAQAHRAGQFVIVQLDSEFGERIPLTIVDANAGEGWILLIFQTVGRTTHRMAQLRVGEAIENLVGPLGRPTRIERYGAVACVGGGIGVAPLYPIARSLRQAGNRIVAILGARTAELLILEDRMRNLADECIVCTDDGSSGRKALVTEPLREICERTPPPDLAVAIGPPVMMKFCAETTRPFGVKTLVSLNTIMVDGTGMCGGCRVTVGGQTRFVCVDGPEFDGHAVDFDNMISRLGAYRAQEQHAHETCHLEMEMERTRAESRHE